MAALGLLLFGIMFLVIFVARTVVQKRRTGDSGIRAGVLGASLGSIEWVAGWLLVIALLAGVVAPVAEMAGLDPWFTSVWVRGVGAAIAVAGIGLTFMSQLSMGDEWRIGVDTGEETGLVTAGAFAVIRNPIFGCMLVAGAGLTVLVPNLISAVGLVLLVAAIELQVRFVEEPHLRRLHSDTYTVYASRVGRLFPRVGRD
ncbi:MAG: isoprenylcysteine carboxylmethyltransferase family protein [Acidimicrobiia bacterium]|nr:isoprenylcysteine carboxylmethyltransferase family protein [Acidimicrobiia bacterium]